MASADFYTKVGDTFYAEGLYTDEAGTPVNLTSVQFEIGSVLISPEGDRTVELEVTPSDQSTSPGQYSLRVDTSDFVPGFWRWDIRFTDAGDSSSAATDTFRVLFAQQVTP